MNLDELKLEKSSKLLDLEAAKRKGDNRSVYKLGSEAAALEGVIARAYTSSGENEKAVINLISEASCLCDAHRNNEAFRIFSKAIQLTSNLKTKEWIVNVLKSLDVNERENLFQSLNPNIANNTLLRKPQRDAYAAAKEYFLSHTGHAIIQLPVGCGKTGAMSIIPFGISGGRVLAIAPNLEIRKNLHKNLDYHCQESFLRKFKVLSNGKGPVCSFLDSEANIHDCDIADIVVTNIQQLAARSSKNWLGMLSPDFFDMILIDEAHHNVAPTWQEALQKFPDAKKLSFTATPLRADGKKVEGERIYRFPITQAIKEGYIKDIASRRLEPHEIYFTYKGERQKVGLEEILRLRENQWFSKGVALSRECNESIVDASIQSLYELRESGEKHQIIAVACSIDHAKSIKALYKERNLEAEVLHSEIPPEGQDAIRNNLENKKLDAIVQVQMLGEGADYPHLSVAALFRPFRHLMPYVQFVGRIMRVIKQNSPGHKANRGFVISHVGLNVDRWWNELKAFDRDDENFFSEIASGDHNFIFDNSTSKEEVPIRRRFKQDMDVIEEAIAHFVQDHFLPEDAKLMVDDLIQAMSMRGIDFESLGLTRNDLEQRLLEKYKETTRKGRFAKVQVSPQQSRKAARQRLDERIRSAAKQLLNELQLKVGGIDLPKLFPSTAAQANLPAAIILLNRAVLEYLNVGSRERDILTEEQLRKAHDNIDDIIDKLAKDIKDKSRG